MLQIYKQQAVSIQPLCHICNKTLTHSTHSLTHISHYTYKQNDQRSQHLKKIIIYFIQSEYYNTDPSEIVIFLILGKRCNKEKLFVKYSNVTIRKSHSPPFVIIIINQGNCLYNYKCMVLNKPRFFFIQNTVQLLCG